MQIRNAIRQTLAAELAPAHLEVHNESAMHNVPPGSETHFKVVAVSEVFAGRSRVARHRLVYELLAAQLAGGVHALTVSALTPEEWRRGGGEVRRSPPCLGGGRA